MDDTKLATFAVREQHCNWNGIIANSNTFEVELQPPNKFIVGPKTTLCRYFIGLLNV